MSETEGSKTSSNTLQFLETLTCVNEYPHAHVHKFPLLPCKYGTSSAKKGFQINDVPRSIRTPKP